MRKIWLLGGLSLLLSSCASVANYPGAKESASAWNDVTSCTKQSYAACVSRFKGLTVNIRVSKVQTISQTRAVVFGDFGSSSREFACFLNGKLADQASKVSPDDVIKVRGNFSQDASRGGARILSLEPCQIFEIVVAAPAKPLRSVE